MTPLSVSARLLEGFVVRHPVHLDGILDAAWAYRGGYLLPPAGEADLQKFPLPLQRSPCGQFWLASAGEYVPANQELRYKNRRAPWVEYARLGSDKIKRCQINFGPNKSYRVPYEFTIPSGGWIRWWAIGDEAEVSNLLHVVHYLGKFRGSGKGRIAEWIVEPAEPWGDDFPVWRDGFPLRNMPVKDGAVGAMLRSEPPYWMREGRRPCLVPVIQVP